MTAFRKASAIRIRPRRYLSEMTTIKNDKMNIFKYILCLVFPLLLLTSCVDEELEKGGYDLEDCYGVYFPSWLNAQKDFSLVPGDKKVLSFDIARMENAGEDYPEIVVPVEVTSNVDGIFTVDPVIFRKGETAAKVNVRFRDARNSVLYKGRIAVTDPQFVLSYGTEPLSVDFSVITLLWNRVTGSDGDRTGAFRDCLLTDIYGNQGGETWPEAEVGVWERDDTPGLYRISNPYNSLVTAWLGSAYDRSSVEYLMLDASEPLDPSKPDGAKKVVINLQSTGVTLNSSEGEIGFCTMPDEYGVLEDGIVTFPAGSIGWTLSGYNPDSPLPGNSSGVMRFVLPGYEAPDYTLEVSAGMSSDNGETEIAFKVGEDVEEVRYAVYEGRLDEGDVFVNADNIFNGDEPLAENLDLVSQKMLFANDKTGFYTLVAVAVADDKEGNPKNMGYTSVDFGHVAAGDDMSVRLTAGMIVSDRYAPEGYTSENSMEFYVYGEGIETALAGFFKTDAIKNKSDEFIMSLLTSNYSGTYLGDKIIAAINGSGWSNLLGNLNAGTEYSMVIYAENGYRKQLFRFDESTLGVKDPHLALYDVTDMTREISKEELFKTWNFYGIPNGRKLSNRIRLGEVTVEEDPDDLPLEDGTSMDVVTFSGVFDCFATRPEDSPENDYDDIDLTFEYYRGTVFTLFNFFNGLTLPYKYEGKTYQVYPGVCALGTGYPYSLEMNFAMIGTMVEEGYIAFVGNPDYYERDPEYPDDPLIDFNALTIDFYADNGNDYYNYYIGTMKSLSYPMLVDPAVDAPAGGTAPELKTAELDDAVRIAGMYRKGPENLVETPRGRMLSIIDRVKSGEYVRNYMDIVKEDIEIEHKAVKSSR